MSALPPGYCPACRIPVVWTELVTGELCAVSIAAQADGDVTVWPRSGQVPRGRILAGDDLTEARKNAVSLYGQHYPTCPARPPQVHS
ncbi:hypothetical protein AB0M43_23670 [Longispora sp. NPDC051575]|uniref:hypothetical protein n=1 Tax=Longispora sp. NPDC051575 TaxID=3154943 RepID=UPI00343FDBF5